MYYKDTQNKVHFLSDADIAAGGEKLLPADSIAITDQEAAAIQAPTPEQIAADAAAKVLADAARNDKIALKADAQFQNLIARDPAGVKNWAQNNFPTLTAPEQNKLAMLVQALVVLARYNN